MPTHSKITEAIQDLSSPRIVIAGGPKTGKTTLADHLSGLGPIRATDDLIGLGWSQASLAASQWLDNPGPWIVEGVATVRALRKWLSRNPQGKPCDLIAYLETAHVALIPGQLSMQKGVATVWRRIYADVAARGVRIL